MQHRLSKGLQFGASYTWSKALGMNGFDNYTQDLRARYYGPLSTDQRHNLSINYSYMLPSPSGRLLQSIFGEWQLSGVTKFQTGTATSPSCSSNGAGIANIDPSLTGIIARCMLVSDPYQGWTVDKDPANAVLFNPAACAMAQPSGRREVFPPAAFCYPSNVLNPIEPPASPAAYPRVASFKTAQALRAHLVKHDIPLPFDDERAKVGESPLAQPIDVDGVRVGNRFCILPMEGWDGTRDGQPSELTRRRWRNFGFSGAKLMWGGEAVAVRAEARANPNQLLMNRHTQPAIAALRVELVAAHRERFGANADADLYVGLQLTHSGRFSRPDVWNRPEPLAACHHPVLDRRFPGRVRVLEDDEIDRLVDDFVEAARLAHGAGFRFVDVKQCHGYFGHELLGARTRPGRYGGSLENRTRFLRNVIEAIHASVPDLAVVVRLSVFDTVPYRKDADGAGVAEDSPEPSPQADNGARRVGFCLLEHDMADALAESRAVLGMLQALGVRWICATAGSPYYNPHVQRPALFPPLDGYDPPEDPLRGVARQIQATAALKAAFPDMVFVGSAYSYLQEWLPHVGQHVVREGLADFVGLGRVALSYPDLPADVLSGVPLRRQALCRTFSDCTTGPRMGLVSGCYPLDPFYAARPEAQKIRTVRTQLVTND